MFVALRREIATDPEKIQFFQALINIAKSGSNQLELLHVGNIAHLKLSTLFFTTQSKKQYGDLILIALNKNQQHVKAMAANSRRIHYLLNNPK